MDVHGERWKEIYKQRQYETYYPFDEVVSFAFRYSPKDRPRSEIKVLDLGCGLGNNLRFLASTGFAATGLDISDDAVSRCEQLLKSEGLNAELVCASCADLPFDDSSFDMVVDRSTFAMLPDDIFHAGLSEVRRILRPSGHLLFTPFADNHSSNGLQDTVVDGLVFPVTGGYLRLRDRGVRFMSANDIRALFRDGWTLKSAVLKEQTEMLKPERDVDSSWNVVAQKA